MTERAAIAGAFEYPAGRYPEMDAFDLYRAVLKGAIREWPVRPQDIDGLMTHPCGYVNHPDNYVHDRLVSELGIRPTFLETINMGGQTYLAMVNRAALAIAAGQCTAVLCVVGGKFLKPSAGGGDMMARAISHPNLEMPYGTFIPALYGMIATQFMHERNVKAEDLARVAVAARKWARINPKARQHKAPELTIQDVLSSRMICEPFHLLDCSLPSDGGGVVLVARADLARKWTKQPAYVAGFGEFHPRGTLSDGGYLVESGASVSGPQAFKRAGMTPKDIDCAQLYDAFTSTPLMLLENLGFCEPGQSAAFVQSGAIDPGGKFPVNTSGGLLSYGHTGDGSGMTMLTEGALQVMGLAGPQQIPKADRVLVHAYGGMMYDHSTMILSREP